MVLWPAQTCSAFTALQSLLASALNFFFLTMLSRVATLLSHAGRASARVARTGAHVTRFPLAALSSPRSFSTFELKVPGMGDSITEGALVKWLKKKGEYVALDEIVLVIETDKVAVDVRSPLAGTLEETLASAGDTVKVGALLAKITPGGAPPAGAAAAAAPAAPAAAAPVAAAAPAKAAPAPVAAAAPPAAPKAPAAPAAAAPTPSAAGSREETRVKMTRMRMRIAQR
jgi:pyruvate/2-oxoglutarate dehydrogenase complex dihydrolipoamide acyltransferase (E2) component